MNSGTLAVHTISTSYSLLYTGRVAISPSWKSLIFWSIAGSSNSNLCAALNDTTVIVVGYTTTIPSLIIYTFIIAVCTLVDCVTTPLDVTISSFKLSYITEYPL